MKQFWGIKDKHPNSIILLNDGRIKMQIIEQNKDQLIAEILNGGNISNNKGVNNGGDGRKV